MRGYELSARPGSSGDGAGGDIGHSCQRRTENEDVRAERTQQTHEMRTSLAKDDANATKVRERGHDYSLGRLGIGFECAMTDPAVRTRRSALDMLHDSDMLIR
jgi:hypothetical protein